MAVRLSATIASGAGLRQGASAAQKRRAVLIVSTMETGSLVKEDVPGVPIRASSLV